MKEIRGFFVFAFSLVLLANLASAYSPYGNFYYSGKGLLDNIITSGAPVLELMFGDYTGDSGEFSSGEMLFIKLLLFILMFVVIQTILKKVDVFKDNKAVVGILSVAIPLIAIRFMSANQLIYMVLPTYGTLGIALTTILPFMIFFLFTYLSGMSGGGRRVSWIFFIIIFSVLWFNRADEIGTIGNQIYGWTMFIMVLIVFFDKNIKSYFQLYETHKFFNKADNNYLASLIADYLTVKNTPNYTSSKILVQKEKDLKKEILARGGSLPP